MRASLALHLRAGRAQCSNAPLLRIKNATFYRRQPALLSTEEEQLSNPALFTNLDFLLPSDPQAAEHWAIIGPSNAGKTTLLEVFQGQHLCFPPTARSYPYLSSDEVRQKDPALSHPARAIKYVGFSSKDRGLSGIGSHLSARYESRREETDFSVQDFLTGNMDLNPYEDAKARPALDAFDKIVNDLQLQNLLEMPVSNLSNGQTRRARIARALLDRPEVLLLDEPFMGLDPPTTVKLNPILRSLAASASPRLVLGLRVQDPIPDWITHVAYLGRDMTITQKGTKADVDQALIDDENLKKSSKLDEMPQRLSEYGRTLTDIGIAPRIRTLSPKRQDAIFKATEKFEDGQRDDTTLRNIGFGEGHEHRDRNIIRNYHRWRYEVVSGEPLVEMDGVAVRYGERAILGNWPRQEYLTDRDGDLQQKQDPDSRPGLHWTVRRGERWAVAGPNGSGKTTLLALILSDHPQSYSQPVKLFGRSRLPMPGQRGMSLFDIQRRIGHSSPEVHAFFPRQLSVRATLESAFADTPLSPVQLDEEAEDRIVAFLRWFQGELNPAKGHDALLARETLSVVKEAQGPLESTNKKDYQREAIRKKWDAWNAVKTGVDWSYDMKFSELTFTGQRVALFLRALVAQPDIVILDEAFSGLDDTVREKCKLFLERGELARMTPYYNRPTLGYAGQHTPHFRTPRETAPLGIRFKGLTDNQALIVVSHVKEEIPLHVRHLLYLPEAGSGEACKVCDVGAQRPLYLDPGIWGTIWGMSRTPAHSLLQYAQFYPDDARANYEQQCAIMQRLGFKTRSMAMSRPELEVYLARPDLRSRKSPWRLRMSGLKGGRPAGSKDSYQRVNRLYENNKDERMKKRELKRIALETRKARAEANRSRRRKQKVHEEKEAQARAMAKESMRQQTEKQVKVEQQEKTKEVMAQRRKRWSDRGSRRAEKAAASKVRRAFFDQQIELSKARHQRDLAEKASMPDEAS